jgi:hypothetical protein
MASDRIEPTYPPLDTLKPVGDGIWIVDSGPMMVMGGAPLPVRMTVVKLKNGDVWLHSPTRFIRELREEIDRLGPVRHLVAPDVAHWTFLQDWQKAYPDALTWAAPGLRDRAQVKKSGVRLARDLGETPPPEWSEDFEQVVVTGIGFSEVDFFHKPSRTLVMTDLVQNFEPHKMPTGMRIFTAISGVTAPNGGTPRYLRLVVLPKRAQARAAAERMLAWQPERVIFSHGRWFERDGTAALKRALSWLV